MSFFHLLLIPFVFGIIVNVNCDYTYTIGYYEQPLDHFSFSNTKTFKMKYLVNDQNVSKLTGNVSPPIFFYTGNEGDIELFAQNTGFMWESAPEFGALILFAEHRYYGASLPFGNDSFSSPNKIGYLTSEQALADFAQFLTWFKKTEKGGFYSGSPVIAFGGSYGGMLTAWMRIKYPHIIQGGIAASAPILFFIDVYKCGRYEKVVTNDFERWSKECSGSIRNSWEHLNTLAKSDVGRNWISSNWKLCKPLEADSGIKELKDWLNSVYSYLSMVDYPYPANFLQPLPGNPIEVFCKQLPDSKARDKILLKSLFKAVSVYFNYTGQSSCLDTNQETAGMLGDNAWNFQACTEMIMPLCSNGVDDFFEPTKWNLAAYIEECKKTWGIMPRPIQAEIMYGGRDIKASSNIVFSNGLLDPWSSGGVMKNLSESLISIIIPEGAHHLDLRAKNPKDPQSVIWAREFEKNQIRKWISQFHQEKWEDLNHSVEPEVILSNEIPLED